MAVVAGVPDPDEVGKWANGVLEPKQPVRRRRRALDAVYSGNKKRGTVRLKVLQVLGESDLAGPGGLAVLEAAWEKPLSKAEERFVATWSEPTRTAASRAGVDGGPRACDNEENVQSGAPEGGPRRGRQPTRPATAPTRPPPPETVDEDELAMEIATAQLRLITDRRLGKVTPDWVKTLAAAKPSRHAS